jgi:hypothetical protein
MGWFRTNRAGVAWLAFFALACQFFLSFGHVHVSKITSAGLAAWVTAEGNDSSSATEPKFPQQRPARLAEGFCGICVNVNIAGALLMVDAPGVTGPSFFFHVMLWPLAADKPVRFHHFLFSARGPPDA